MHPLRQRSTLPALAVLASALATGGCEAITGSNDGGTRILMSREGSGASFSINAVSEASPGPEATSGAAAATPDAAPHSHGTATLALVSDLEFTITAVQALPAGALDGPEEENGWQTITLASPVTVNLLALPEEGSGVEIMNGELEAGPYVRLRFLVSEANLVLAAPLTLSGKVFAANEEIELRIPTPWISVPGSYFVVDEDEDGEVEVVFDAASSFGQITVAQGGKLTLVPVFRGKGNPWGSPPPWAQND